MARPSFLASISSARLEAEIRLRERVLAPLLRRRAKVAAKLAALDRRLAALGGRAGPARRAGAAGPRGRRAKNAKTLAETLVSVLRGKTLSVSEAAAAVKRAGYRTNSRHFRTQVNIALFKDRRFKRVSRGKYTAR